jgi:hypothetical protein
LQHFDLHLVLVVELVNGFVDFLDLPLDLHLLPEQQSLLLVAELVLRAVSRALIILQTVVRGSLLDSVPLLIAGVAGQFLQGELLNGLHVLLHDERVVFIAAFAKAEKVAFLVSHLYYDEVIGVQVSMVTSSMPA